MHSSGKIGGISFLLCDKKTFSVNLTDSSQGSYAIKNRFYSRWTLPITGFPLGVVFFLLPLGMVLHAVLPWIAFDHPREENGGLTVGLARVEV